jgi:uncharacterized protein with GYD domain
MSKYVVLFNYTGAIEGGGPERFVRIQQLAAAANCEILQVYGLLGAYDIVAVVECPDHRTAMKLAAQTGNLIGAKTQTMPAVERDDFLKLLTEL